MNTETPGTPLSPEAEQRIREWVAEDKRRGAINSLASHGTASGLTVEALLATLDRERRERVDPDRIRREVIEAVEEADRDRTEDEGGIDAEAIGNIVHAILSSERRERVDPDLRARIEKLPNPWSPEVNVEDFDPEAFVDRNAVLALFDEPRPNDITAEDMAEAFCFVEAHDHLHDEPVCEAGLRVGDAAVKAHAVRLAYSAATPDHTEGGEEPTHE
jgi:hypothetical protein